ncbi:unnamed protein product, partial [Medioppia subpectinata]
MGYDRNRFMHHNPEHLDEFTCGICMDILVQPVFSPCCRHSYCSVCIRQWLMVNNTCPNDRAQLRDTDLIKQSRAFVNLLDNLQLKCDWVDYGCDDSVRLCELADHVKKCVHNPGNKCANCDEYGAKNHDCLENLRQKCRRLEADVKRLSGANGHSTGSTTATDNGCGSPHVALPCRPMGLRINSCELDANIRERVIEIASRLCMTCTTQRELAVQIKQ